MIAVDITALAATVLCLGILLGLLRWKAYRKKVPYDPRQSFCLGVAGPTTQTIPLDSDGGDILLPKSLNGVVSGFIEIDVRTSALGHLFDPAIEIRSGSFCDIQHLERGARGTRFLNVSRLLNSSGRGERIHLHGHQISWSSPGIRLHTCEETIAPDDRVLVIAPHPDDAEIAAHGVYAKHLATTVVTLTAGNASDRYQGLRHSSMTFSRDSIARLRVWDSVVIPQYCGLPSEHVLNLCFPDGALKEMFRHPERNFQLDNEAPGAHSFSELRRINRSSLIEDGANCTWTSLVRELGRIIEDVKPTIVVCPHPTLDPHPDHVFATVALCEALKGAEAATGRMFLYSVHNRRTELWPFGPTGSGVALLPIIADDGVCASGFYSHALSSEDQEQKFVALEAMHDIREIQLQAALSTGQLVAEMMTGLRGWAHGLGRTPKSYLRRAVRPDELFFVTSLKEGMILTDRALHQTLRVSTA